MRRTDAPDDRAGPDHVTFAGRGAGVRDAAPEQVAGLRRAAYVVLAAICLALGLLGAVLPGLPTTPFLLLMSFLLVRSSPRLHQRVLRLPVVGRHLRDWDENRGVRRSVKSVAYGMVLLMMALVMTAGLGILLKLSIAMLALVGIGVIRRLPTVEPEERDVQTSGTRSSTASLH